MTYEKFIESKRIKLINSGIDIDKAELSNYLFPYQKDISKWALKRGRAAIFTDTGTGKTNMQLEWASQLYKRLGINIIILSPLAVREQTIQEAKDKLNIDINDHRINGHKAGINITNYQQLEHIDPSLYQAIVLDESSILKSLTGSTRKQLTETFKDTPYKLCCTATPSPNDYQELGQHAEFLNVMRATEMLSMFFVHDCDSTQEWRLKGHAENKFWEWVATWAVVMRKPEDLGYESNYQLPALNVETIIIDKDIKKDGDLFADSAKTLEERRLARKSSIEERVEVVSNIANSNDEMYLIWADYNLESEQVSKKVKGIKEITGSNDDDYKAKTMLEFSKGDIRAIVSKPKIAGHGMNWQKCHNIIYCGLSDSFEYYYQSVRRCYRYGQKQTVNVWIVISSGEIEVLKNIQRKERDFNKMMDSIVIHTRKHVIEHLKVEHKSKSIYNPDKEMILPEWLTNNKR